MRIKILFTLCALVCASSFMKAQDEIVYDQYHFNYYLVNPAVAGAERCSHLMLTGKFQWIGMEDAPMTQTLSFRTRILKNVGLGAYVYNDKNGSSYRQGGQATFAYHIPLSENRGYFMKERSIERQLSFGLSAVASRYAFSSKLFSDENASDPSIGNGDTDKDDPEDPQAIAAVQFQAISGPTTFEIYDLAGEFLGSVRASDKSELRSKATGLVNRSGVYMVKSAGRVMRLSVTK